MGCITISSEYTIKENIQEHNLKDNIQEIENFADCKLSKSFTIKLGGNSTKYLHHVSARSLKSISSYKIILHPSNS